MIDHITFGVSDIARSISFYDQALASLGVRRLFDVPKENSDGIQATGYGDDRPWFWVSEENAPLGLFHVALQAKSRSDVDAFFAAAIRAGGTDNGKPGLRPRYHPNYYAAFVFDPDGHNVEAVCHLSEKT